MAKPKLEKEEVKSYFASAKEDIEFILTGCAILDCVLGGGWALGRVGNIVGDKSTGKTLLAIEACANFARQYKQGRIWYREVESAFDVGYAEALGLPVSRVDFGEGIETVEDIFEDMQKVFAILKPKQQGLYIVDSLDALTDRAEIGRDIDAGSYNMEKAKKLGQLFRRLVRQIGRRKVSVLIISQVRDNIGVSFGRKTTRSGGRALDFYASQVLYLTQIEKLKRTINKVVRTIGVRIKAHCDKNKVALPFRECEFNLMFGYGLDDVTANLEWLNSVGRISEIGVAKTAIKETAQKVMTLSDAERLEMMASLAATVEKVWYEVEQSFLPKRKKY